MSLEEASVIATFISVVIGIVYMVAKGIYYLGYSKKIKRFNKGSKNIKKFFKPYIINRFIFRSLLFLDIVIYISGTALCIFYCNAIADSHNIYLAFFVALALMVANINVLYRAALLYRSLQKQLA